MVFGSFGNEPGEKVMKKWPKVKIRKALQLGYALWYANRPGVHTVSESECGHDFVIGGGKCIDCLMNDMQEFFRDKRLKRVQS